MSKEIYLQLLRQLQNGQEVVLKTRLSGQKGGIEQDMTREIEAGSQCKGIGMQAVNQGMALIEIQPKQTVLAESFFPQERLIVLGGGHIAVPLTEFAAKVGFFVVVIDDRPGFANKGRFPLAKQVICEAFDTAISQLEINRNDYLVLITRGHRHDQTCLEQLLKANEPFYTGMIGSRRRVGAVKEILIEAGCNPQRLANVHTPIGLAIGAVTPEEIAISIVAELIACKRHPNNGQNSNAAGHTRRSDVDYEVLRLLAEETEEPKSVVTVISSKGSVPRSAGARMLVYPFGEIVGSIGGGCSEAAVIRDARQMIGSGGYEVKTVDLTGDIAENDGMVCGGVMQLLIEDYC